MGYGRNGQSNDYWKFNHFIKNEFMGTLKT